MKWLKDNWTQIVLIVLVIILLGFFMRGCQSSAVDKERLAVQDKKIEKANMAIAAYMEGAEGALRRARELERGVIEFEDKIKKLIADNKVLSERQRDLEGKVEAMTPDEVVLGTRVLLETKEVDLKEIGVVFSLKAARTNLTALESFSLCKVKVKNFTEAVEKSGITITGLNNAISEYKTAIIEKDGALSVWETKEASWGKKFNLSQARQKANWWRGLGQGALLGAGAVFLLRILLAK